MTQENNVQKKSSNPKIVVIALAIICVILAASLVGVIAIYQPNNLQTTQLADRDATISSLQQQVASLQERLANTANASTYVTQIAYLNQELLDMNDTLTTTNSDMASLQSILQLQTTGTLYDDSFIQLANTTTTLWDDTLDYAGYVVVEATATANTTYAEVSYTYGGVNFDFTQPIGQSGTTLFPVLTSTVTVKIGNTNQTASNSVIATATYYY
jgi:hypothetical protein